MAHAYKSSFKYPCKWRMMTSNQWHRSANKFSHPDVLSIWLLRS